MGYVCGGKLYKGVQDYLGSLDASCFKDYNKGDQTWDFVEFGDKPGSWSRYRRAIFCRPTYENRQGLLEFSRPDTLIYTNLGMGQVVDAQLRAAGKEELLSLKVVSGSITDAVGTNWSIGPSKILALKSFRSSVSLPTPPYII